MGKSSKEKSRWSLLLLKIREQASKFHFLHQPVTWLAERPTTIPPPQQGKKTGHRLEQRRLRVCQEAGPDCLVEEEIEESAQSAVLVGSERLASLIELAVIEHGDQVAEGITEEYKHLEFRSHRTSTIAQEFLEAFQSAVWTKAVEKKPERSQQEVAKAETVEDIYSQLGESSDCSLV